MDLYITLVKYYPSSYMWETHGKNSSGRSVCTKKPCDNKNLTLVVGLI